MIIDKEIISGGITPYILGRLIELHRGERDRYILLENYYLGRHKINARRKKSSLFANNRLVCNHAKYITDMVQSYLTGNPVTYAAAKDYDIEPLKNEYLEQDIHSIDNEIVKNMSIYGRAYELIYTDERTKARSAVLSPVNTFICYSQTAEKKKLMAVYYYKKQDLMGTCTGVVCRVYDEKYVYTYDGVGDSFNSLALVDKKEHYFGEVPVIEYDNNTERQGDYEPLISLIDAYNVLMSDRVNDKEQFVDSILFLVECELDGEQRQKLIEERILMGYAGASAQYLSKTLNEADTKVLRDDIKADIHKLSNVPDLSDESFGNNLSGVAIKYKLLGFEQHIKNKERMIAAGLRTRFRIYNSFLFKLSKMEDVPTHRVDIVFTYNLPANELELSQMVANLNGIVSSETLLETLPFVTDAKEEVKLADKEREKRQLGKIREVQEIAKGGGW